MCGHLDPSATLASYNSWSSFPFQSCTFQLSLAIEFLQVNLGEKKKVERKKNYWLREKGKSEDDNERIDNLDGKKTLNIYLTIVLTFFNPWDFCSTFTFTWTIIILIILIIYSESSLFGRFCISLQSRIKSLFFVFSSELFLNLFSSSFSSVDLE